MENPMNDKELQKFMDSQPAEHWDWVGWDNGVRETTGWYHVRWDGHKFVMVDDQQTPEQKERLERKSRHRRRYYRMIERWY